MRTYIEIGVAITVLVGAVLSTNSYFAKADEVKEVQVYNNLTHLEMRIERYQDKLEDILAVPEDQRQQWEVREELRLSAKIREMERRIERIDDAMENDGWFGDN